MTKERIAAARLATTIRLLRAYEDRVSYWLKAAESYPRATHGRREAVAYATAFTCMVDDLRELVPSKDRRPNQKEKSQ